MFVRAFKLVYSQKNVQFCFCKKFSTNNIKYSAKIIDGKQIAENILNEIKNELVRTKCYRNPHITAVIVGNDPSSEVYIKNKRIAADKTGITSKIIKLDKDISVEALKEIILELNQDKTTDGILVQFPLPSHLNESKISDLIETSKDIDGLNYKNLGRIFKDNTDVLMPCTPLAVLEILKRTHIETKGKLAVVCGRSKNVGLPLAMLLQADHQKSQWGMDTTVCICNRHTNEKVFSTMLKNADVLISATGVKGLIKSHHVKPGACVIDVGITRTQIANGKIKLFGDVDFENVSKVAGYITPVPGGVGPVTIAMLLRNTFIAWKKHLIELK